MDSRAMNNLHCHTGRTFTLNELNDQAKAARESMARELAEALKDKDGATDNVEDDVAGL
jgi:hypothetical protein